MFSRYAQEITVRRLVKAGRLADIETLIESHKNDPKIKQEPYLSTLIRSYGIAGMFDHALKTFNQMDELGTPRSCISLNVLLAACNQSKLYEKVPQLFDELPKKYEISPDKVSYGILVRSYCERGMPESAMKTLSEMEEKGVEVTPVTFTTILGSLYENGKNDEAEAFWNEMVDKGCSPDVVTYNVKIKHVHGGEPGDVKSLMEEMVAAGLNPDTISYNYLMTSYFKKGMIEDAEKVYEGLETNGCAPNAATFRTKIFYLCKNGLFERGYKVFKESVEKNKIPDFATLRILLEGLVEKKKTKDAKALIRTVKKKFPVVKSWEKIEVELGLVSNESSDSEVIQEATA